MKAAAKPSARKDVLTLQFGPLPEHLVHVHAAAQVRENRGDRHPESAHARLAEALLGVHRDAIKLMVPNFHGYYLRSLGLLARDYRELPAHSAVTTTLPTRTPAGSGIAAPLARMSSRQSSIASLIFAIASATVSPWL